MTTVQIDESRACEFIDKMDNHQEVVDVWREVTKRDTRIIVDGIDVDLILADMDEFVLDPHDRKAKNVITVVFL